MSSDIEKVEIELFLAAIYKCYGYDFRNYAKASIKRRIKHILKRNNYSRITDLTADILHDKSVFENVIYDFSVPVTEMFRDPLFYVELREKIIPYLRTFPFIKIWHAGCATGEEVYSMAILLKEEGLYDKSTIFATDFNEVALNKAREGIYSLKNIQMFTKNYQNANGKASFADYYHAKYKSAIMDKSLMNNVTFANHNLVTDSTFGEMNLILCRNVLIYFDRSLQDRAFNLFDDSLVNRGFLALGSKETLEFSTISNKYKTINRKYKIYQKK